MDQVWDAVASAIREVVAALPEPPELVAVTGQGDGAWLVDGLGRPTGPAVLWNDGRAAGLVMRLGARRHPGAGLQDLRFPAVHRYAQRRTCLDAGARP